MLHLRYSRNQRLCVESRLILALLTTALRGFKALLKHFGQTASSNGSVANFIFFTKSQLTD
jgi:hypothetical protein